MSSVPGLNPARVTGCYYDNFIAQTAHRKERESLAVEEFAEESNEAVKSFIFSAISENTRRTYQGPQRRYTDFCYKTGREPLPVDALAVLHFLARESHADYDKSSRTIGLYRSALSTMHAESEYGGQPNPLDDPRIARLLVGVKKSKIESDAEKREAATPTAVLTPKFLVDHEAYFGMSDEPANVMKWAACCLGSFAALRKTELIGSSFYPERRLKISQIKFYHTDLTRTVIAIPAPSIVRVEDINHFSISLGATKADPLAHNKPSLCFSAVAIRAMWKWMHLRHSLTRAEVPQLFTIGTTHLDYATLMTFVQNMFVAKGDGRMKFTGKAFRKGAASELVASNVPNSVSADLGRWRTTHMVETYATPAAKAARFEQMSRELGHH